MNPLKKIKVRMEMLSVITKEIDNDRYSSLLSASNSSSYSQQSNIESIQQDSAHSYTNL